jgi:hypothetical protein
LLVVFDFDLQMRFWRSVTDAVMHSTEASFAAAAAWQNEVLTPAPKPKPASSPLFPMLSAFPMMPVLPLVPTFPMMDTTALPWASIWGSNPWLGGDTAMAKASNPFLAPFASTMPWVEIFWRQSAEVMPVTQSAWGSFPQANPAMMFGPFWNWAASPWAYMQTPITAMMMSAGFPYDVASPSAKASTAALDAADAARKQMDNVFSAYRTDGGHAAAQLVTLPWTLAASFISAAQSDNSKLGEAA